MTQTIHSAEKGASLSVSPYLMRPLRSYEQALADIATAKRRANTVTPFIPSLVPRVAAEAPRPRSRVAA